MEDARMEEDGRWKMERREATFVVSLNQYSFVLSEVQTFEIAVMSFVKRRVGKNRQKSEVDSWERRLEK
jgi:hypothetical protein